MFIEVQKEIHRFWNVKGVEPNALLLGIDVIKGLMAEMDVLKECKTEKSYVCGCEVLMIDFADPKKIQAVLI